jgi:hypothetical protein
LASSSILVNFMYLIGKEGMGGGVSGTTRHLGINGREWKSCGSLPLRSSLMFVSLSFSASCRQMIFVGERHTVRTYAKSTSTGT